MKEYKLEIKEEVHKYIYEIWEYIFRFSFSFSISNKVVKDIYKNIFSLKIFPERFPKFNETYRVFTINKKYRVFYRIDEEKNKVVVSRIFSSYEDYENVEF